MNKGVGIKMRTETFVNMQLSNTRKGLGGAGYSNEELGISQFIMLAVTRDSDTLSRSNWEVISNKMLNEFPDDVHIERFNHWACGWIDYLIVEAWVYGPAEDYIGSAVQATEAAIAAEDWLLKLKQYPVANEEHYSQMESDELDEYLKNWYAGHNMTASYPMRDNDRLRHDVQSWLFETLSIDSVTELSDTDVTGALLDLAPELFVD
jgi:hypothetical protein